MVSIDIDMIVIFLFMEKIDPSIIACGLKHTDKYKYLKIRFCQN